jgi:hypothetical protein
MPGHGSRLCSQSRQAHNLPFWRQHLRHRELAAVAALVFAVSCGSDGPSEPTGTSGTFTFNFGGTMVSGSYSASGSLPSNGSTAQAWAAGFNDTTDDYIGIVAVAPRTGAGARYDQVILAVDRNTTGSTSIDVGCDPDGTAICTGMLLWYNISDAGGLGEVLCVLETGTVTIASVSSSRVTGSFSGNGICVAQDDGDEGTFTVTNGSFNVPLVSNTGGNLMRRSQ